MQKKLLVDVDYECMIPSNVERKCEGEHMALECPGTNEFINIKSARLGRHEDQLCPVAGQASDPARCPMLAVQDEVGALCQNRKSCSVIVDGAMFGTNACPGTSQYLEVDYECGPGTPDVRTCDGETMSIACSAGGMIRVDSAVYGRTLSTPCQVGQYSNTDCAADVLADVKEACESKESCDVEVLAAHFRDNCPGTSKFLDVDYHCEAPTQGEVVCEHAEMAINCAEGETIQIQSAGYGRWNYSTCDNSAMSTASCSASGALNTVKGLCDGKSSCSVKASNSVFGDPCYGTYKYLEVQYKCVS